MAYESRKLMAAERNYQGHVLELLAVVHSLRAFRTTCLAAEHLGPRPGGCWSDLDLQNQC